MCHADCWLCYLKNCSLSKLHFAANFWLTSLVSFALALFESPAEGSLVLVAVLNYLCGTDLLTGSTAMTRKKNARQDCRHLWPRQITNAIQNTGYLDAMVWLLMFSFQWTRTVAAHIPPPSHVSSNAAAQPCTGCSREQLMAALNDERDLLQLRIEVIKEQILQRLEFDRRPDPLAVSKDLTVPRSLLKHSAVEESQSAAMTSQQLETMLLFPTEDQRHTNGTQIAFVVTDELRTYSVNSATLWIPLAASVLSGSSALSWTSTDVTSIVNDHLTQARSTLVFNTSTSSLPARVATEQKPYILVKLDERKKRGTDVTSQNTTTPHAGRMKRSTPSCSGPITECCRESMYVSFRDIGWDDWIIAPKGFNAYFCRGSCGSTASALSNSASPHTALLKKLLAKNALASDIRSKLTPCCSPTRLSPLTVFYTEGSDVVKQRVLHNMIVESCGCAL